MPILGARADAALPGRQACRVSKFFTLASIADLGGETVRRGNPLIRGGCPTLCWSEYADLASLWALMFVLLLEF